MVLKGEKVEQINFDQFSNSMRFYCGGTVNEFYNVPLSENVDLLKVIRRNGRSAHFLHYVYTKERNGLRDHFFMRTQGPRSVFNRIPFVVHIAGKELARKLENKKSPLIIADIGGGLGFMANAIAYKYGKEVEVHLVDSHEEVIEKGKKITERIGNSKNIHFVKNNAEDFLKKNQQRFDLIISMGIVDYLSDKDANDFLKKAHNNVKSGGAIALTHIGKYFLSSLADKSRGEGVLNPNYREKNEVRSLLEKVGFSVEDITKEPLNVHTIAWGRKQ